MSTDRILIEPRIRYDQTFRYALHDAYFQSRGIAAWTEHEIPHEITTNIGSARLHARLLVVHFTGVEASLGEAPYVVLEIGGGLGRFAGNVIRALDDLAESDPAAGRLAARLVYLFSDVSPVSVGEAAEAPDLAPHVASGRVLPTVFDVRTPGTLTTLAEEQLDAPLHAVIANYLVCTTPMRIVQRGPAGWSDAYGELWVKNQMPDEAPPSPEEIRASYLADPARPDAIAELEAVVTLEEFDPGESLGTHHASVLEALLSPYPVGTVAYPVYFVDCMRHVGERMGPGGLLLLTDLGRGDAPELGTAALPDPQHYGNTLNHVVNFGLFDAVGTAFGWGVVRTFGHLPSVHQALLTVGEPVSDALAAAFQLHVVDHHEGHELLDLTDAALDAVKREAYHRAVRFFEKAVALDPKNPRLIYQYAETCVLCGLMVPARDLLLRAMALDPDETLDCDFLLGRVYASLGEHDAALEQLFHSLRKSWHHITLANIAEVYRLTDNLDEAYRYYRHALTANPEHEHARQRLESLRDEWWAKRTAAVDAQLAAADTHQD